MNSEDFIQDGWHAFTGARGISKYDEYLSQYRDRFRKAAIVSAYCQLSGGAPLDFEAVSLAILSGRSGDGAASFISGLKRGEELAFEVQRMMMQEACHLASFQM